MAGKNVTLSLPQTWTLLDGSKSNDDIGIEKWKWYQIRYTFSIFFNIYNISHNKYIIVDHQMYISIKLTSLEQMLLS